MKRRGDDGADWARVELERYSAPRVDLWLAIGSLIAGFAIGFATGFIGGATWW